MGWFIFDGVSVIIVFTLCLLCMILLGIFARRQIVRLRNNSARNKPNVQLPFSKRTLDTIGQQLNLIQRFRSSYQPRLTDCATIAQHSDAPYKNRMIALDEITREIDGNMAMVDMPRQPGESTIDYLTRLRVRIPALPISLCERISYLQDAARFGPMKFEMQHLMELRSLLNQFVKIINNENIQVAQPSPPKNIVSTFYNKLNPAAAHRRNRSKFGGSDDNTSDDDSAGGRLLAGNVADEQICLLPLGDPSTRIRRQSESHRNLLD